MSTRVFSEDDLLEAGLTGLDSGKAAEEFRSVTANRSTVMKARYVNALAGTVVKGFCMSSAEGAPMYCINAITPHRDHPMGGDFYQGDIGCDGLGVYFMGSPGAEPGMDVPEGVAYFNQPVPVGKLSSEEDGGIPYQLSGSARIFYMKFPKDPQGGERFPHVCILARKGVNREYAVRKYSAVHAWNNFSRIDQNLVLMDAAGDWVNVGTFTMEEMTWAEKLRGFLAVGNTASKYIAPWIFREQSVEADEDLQQKIRQMTRLFHRVDALDLNGIMEELSAEQLDMIENFDPRQHEADPAPVEDAEVQAVLEKILEKLEIVKPTELVNPNVMTVLGRRWKSDRECEQLRDIPIKASDLVKATASVGAMLAASRKGCTLCWATWRTASAGSQDFYFTDGDGPGRRVNASRRAGSMADLGPPGIRIESFTGQTTVAPFIACVGEDGTPMDAPFLVARFNNHGLRAAIGSGGMENSGPKVGFPKVTTTMITRFLANVPIVPLPFTVNVREDVVEKAKQGGPFDNAVFAGGEFRVPGMVEFAPCAAIEACITPGWGTCYGVQEFRERVASGFLMGSVPKGVWSGEVFYPESEKQSLSDEVARRGKAQNEAAAHIVRNATRENAAEGGAPASAARGEPMPQRTNRRRGGRSGAGQGRRSGARRERRRPAQPLSTENFRSYVARVRAGVPNVYTPKPTDGELGKTLEALMAFEANENPSEEDVLRYGSTKRIEGLGIAPAELKAKIEAAGRDVSLFGGGIPVARDPLRQRTKRGGGGRGRSDPNFGRILSILEECSGQTTWDILQMTRQAGISDRQARTILQSMVRRNRVVNDGGRIWLKDSLDVMAERSNADYDRIVENFKTPFVNKLDLMTRLGWDQRKITSVVRNSPYLKWVQGSNAILVQAKSQWSGGPKTSGQTTLATASPAQPQAAMPANPGQMLLSMVGGGTNPAPAQEARGGNVAIPRNALLTVLMALMAQGGNSLSYCHLGTEPEGLETTGPCEASATSVYVPSNVSCQPTTYTVVDYCDWNETECRPHFHASSDYPCDIVCRNETLGPDHCFTLPSAEYDPCGGDYPMFFCADAYDNTLHCLGDVVFDRVEEGDCASMKVGVSSNLTRDERLLTDVDYWYEYSEGTFTGYVDPPLDDVKWYLEPRWEPTQTLICEQNAPCTVNETFTERGVDILATLRGVAGDTLFERLIAVDGTAYVKELDWAHPENLLNEDSLAGYNTSDLLFHVIVWAAILTGFIGILYLCGIFKQIIQCGASVAGCVKSQGERRFYRMIASKFGWVDAPNDRPTLYVSGNEISESWSADARVISHSAPEYDQVLRKYEESNPPALWMKSGRAYRTPKAMAKRVKRGTPAYRNAKRMLKSLVVAAIPGMGWTQAIAEGGSIVTNQPVTLEESIISDRFQEDREFLDGIRSGEHAPTEENILRSINLINSNLHSDHQVVRRALAIDEACPAVAWVGDGTCQDIVNVVECRWDDYDCCDPSANTTVCSLDEMGNPMQEIASNIARCCKNPNSAWQSAIDQAMNPLQMQLGMIQQAIGEVTVTISGHAEDIETLEEGHGNQTYWVEYLNSYYTQMDDQIAEAMTEITSILAWQSEAIEKLEYLNGNQTRIFTEIDDRVTSEELGVGQAIQDGEIASMASDVAQCTSDIEEVTANLTSVWNEFTEVHQEYVHLDGFDVEQVENDIEEIQASLKEARSAISIMARRALSNIEDLDEAIEMMDPPAAFVNSWHGACDVTTATAGVTTTVDDGASNIDVKFSSIAIDMRGFRSETACIEGTSIVDDGVAKTNLSFMVAIELIEARTSYSLNKAYYTGLYNDDYAGENIWACADDEFCGYHWDPLSLIPGTSANSYAEFDTSFNKEDPTLGGYAKDTNCSQNPIFYDTTGSSSCDSGDSSKCNWCALGTGCLSARWNILPAGDEKESSYTVYNIGSSHEEYDLTIHVYDENANTDYEKNFTLISGSTDTVDVNGTSVEVEMTGGYTATDFKFDDDDKLFASFDLKTVFLGPGANTGSMSSAVAGGAFQSGDVSKLWLDAAYADDLVKFEMANQAAEMTIHPDELAEAKKTLGSSTSAYTSMGDNVSVGLVRFLNGTLDVVRYDPQPFKVYLDFKGDMTFALSKQVTEPDFCTDPKVEGQYASEKGAEITFSAKASVPGSVSLKFFDSCPSKASDVFADSSMNLATTQLSLSADCNDVKVYATSEKKSVSGCLVMYDEYGDSIHWVAKDMSGTLYESIVSLNSTKNAATSDEVHASGLGIADNTETPWIEEWWWIFLVGGIAIVGAIVLWCYCSRRSMMKKASGSSSSMFVSLNPWSRSKRKDDDETGFDEDEESAETPIVVSSASAPRRRTRRRGNGQ